MSLDALFPYPGYEPSGAPNKFQSGQTELIKSNMN